MNIDTQTFFLVILSGFAFVWSFRRFSKIDKEISDFEYLGFSAFWGVLILAGYTEITKGKPEILESLIKNPLAAGLTLSLLGGFVGYIFGKFTQKISKLL